jgi:hypothetical protein
VGRDHSLESFTFSFNNRTGLPKKTETYFLFQITDANRFRKQLNQFVPLVKSVAQVIKDRKAIDEHKGSGNETLLTMVGVNFALSHKGFVKVDNSLGGHGYRYLMNGHQTAGYR